jgi:hypothetical protein
MIILADYGFNQYIGPLLVGFFIALITYFINRINEHQKHKKK